MSDLKILLESVKAATGPDRELDAAIAAALKHAPATLADYAKSWTGEWIAASNGLVVLKQEDGANGPNFRAYTYTASVDAALALVEHVLPGAMKRVYDNPDDGGCYAQIVTEAGSSAMSDGASWPLAILAALLVTKIAETQP